MKKIIFVLCLFFTFSCNNDNEETQNSINNDNELVIQQNLPDNVESVTMINQDNENLQAFFKVTNFDNQKLNLEEISLIKFKGDESKYAFSIPMKSTDNDLTENLFVYFKLNDLTKFTTLIHSQESSKNIEGKDVLVIRASNIDKSWSIKKEYVDGLLLTQDSNSKSMSCSCVIPNFTLADLDGNGLIDEIEFNIADNSSNGAITCNSGSFASLDLDGDGELNETEYPSCYSICVGCKAAESSCHTQGALGAPLCYAAVYALCAFEC